MSEAPTLDRLVASKAAADDFTRTRWWWIRHAPVRVDEGRIYGQRDLPCDCSDAPVFSGLAALLPQDAIWVTSHLVRTVQTAKAIQAAGNFAVPEIHQDKDFAEQHLGDWQGLDRRNFLLNRQQEPDSFWYAAADERAPNGESFVDVIERVRAAHCAGEPHLPGQRHRRGRARRDDPCGDRHCARPASRAAGSPSPSTIARSRGSTTIRANAAPDGASRWSITCRRSASAGTLSATP